MEGFLKGGTLLPLNVFSGAAGARPILSNATKVVSAPFGTSGWSAGVFDHRNVHRNSGMRSHLSCNREHLSNLCLLTHIDVLVLEPR